MPSKLHRRRYKKKYGIATRTIRKRLFRPPYPVRLSVKGLHTFKRVCNISNPVHTNAVFSASSGNLLINIDDSWDCQTGAAAANANYFSFGVNFTLDMLPDFSEFTTLFDMYKISAIKFRLTPYANQAPVQTSSAAGTSNQSVSGFVHTILDYDDSTAPNPSKAGIDSIRQFESYKCRQLFQPGTAVDRYFKPRIATPGYGGSVFTSFINQKAPWIDCNSGNVEHYGVKGIIQIFQPIALVDAHYWFKVEVTAYLAFRNPR